MTDLKHIEALAQRGLDDEQIRTIIGAEFDAEDREALKRGRAAGMSVINDKLFEKAKAGDPEAVRVMNQKFANTAKSESYTDRQLRILHNINK